MSLAQVCIRLENGNMVGATSAVYMLVRKRGSNTPDFISEEYRRRRAATLLRHYNKENMYAWQALHVLNVGREQPYSLLYIHHNVRHFFNPYRSDEKKPKLFLR